MDVKLAALLIFFVAATLVGNAYAHKSQTIGDYKIEVGWAKEPPVAGKSNSLEIIITKASTSEKNTKSSHKHDDKKTEEDHASHGKSEKKAKKSSHTNHESKTTKNGVKGLAKKLAVDITLNDKKTSLVMKENPKKPGTYTAKYMPESEGHATVHIYAKIKNTEIEGSFHPEKVESR